MAIRLRLLLLLPLAMLAVVLFPFGWLTLHWPAFATFMGVLFTGWLSHAIGHTILFVGLGLALLVALPGLRRRPWLYAGLILIAALGQEGFQLLYKGRGVNLNDLNDLVIDMVAAAIAWGVVGWGRMKDEGWMK